MHSLNYSECIYINDVFDAFIDGVLLVGAWIGFQMRSDFIERLISWVFCFFAFMQIFMRGELLRKFPTNFDWILNFIGNFFQTNHWQPQRLYRTVFVYDKHQNLVLWTKVNAKLCAIYHENIHTASVYITYIRREKCTVQCSNGHYTVYSVSIYLHAFRAFNIRSWT